MGQETVGTNLGPVSSMEATPGSGTKLREANLIELDLLPPPRSLGGGGGAP